MQKHPTPQARSIVKRLPPRSLHASPSRPEARIGSPGTLPAPHPRATGARGPALWPPPFTHPFHAPPHARCAAQAPSHRTPPARAADPKRAANPNDRRELPRLRSRRPRPGHAHDLAPPRLVRCVSFGSRARGLYPTRTRPADPPPDDVGHRPATAALDTRFQPPAAHVSRALPPRAREASLTPPRAAMACALHYRAGSAISRRAARAGTGEVTCTECTH